MQANAVPPEPRHRLHCLHLADNLMRAGARWRLLTPCVQRIMSHRCRAPRAPTPQDQAHRVCGLLDPADATFIRSDRTRLLQTLYFALRQVQDSPQDVSRMLAKLRWR